MTDMHWGVEKFLGLQFHFLLKPHSSADRASFYLVYLAETWELAGTKEVLLEEEDTPTNHLIKIWTQLITIKTCILSGTEFVPLQSICEWLNSCWFLEMHSEILNGNWCLSVDCRLLKDRGYLFDLLCEIQKVDDLTYFIFHNCNDNVQNKTYRGK